MIEARELKLYILSQQAYLLEWVNGGYSEADLLSIERSEAPESGFAEIGTVADTLTTFTDTNPLSHQKYKPFYYRIKNPNDSYTPVVHLPYKRDKHALQHIRMTERALRRDIGAESYLFHRLTDGNRCPDCWVESLSQSQDADCPACLGTTYAGGYSQGQQMFIHFPPDSPDLVIVAHTRYKIATSFAFTTNYPLISPEDIIVRNIDKEVFKVGTPVRKTGRRLYVARQMFPCRVVERGSIEYSLIDRIADTKVEQP